MLAASPPVTKGPQPSNITMYRMQICCGLWMMYSLSCTRGVLPSYFMGLSWPRGIMEPAKDSALISVSHCWSLAPIIIELLVLVPFLSWASLHGIIFPFISDRNPLWTLSNVTLKNCFSQNKRPCCRAKTQNLYVVPTRFPPCAAALPLSLRPLLIIYLT